jgi:hypothetical protein
MSAASINDMHAAETSGVTACSGQRVSNTFTGAGARERAARVEMHAAEGSEPAACSGRRAHDTLSGSVGRNERAARIETDAAEGYGPTASCARRLHTPEDDLGLGSPDADRAPLSPSGSGVTPAAFSLQTHPAVSDGRRVLSREEFVRIAAPLLEEGASWREVGEACALSARAAQHRAAHAGLVSKRKPGRPFGSVNSPETMARIAETLRRRRLEGRR